MNIGIVAWSLFNNFGGIERNCCNLAVALQARGHAVTLLCAAPKKAGAKPVYPLPEKTGVALLKLDYDTRDLREASTAVAALNLDVLAAIFSWESLLWFPSLLKPTGIPLVISERNSPEYINGKWNAYERHCCLDAADAIHVLGQGFAASYPEQVKERISVIPNPAFLPDTPVPARDSRDRRTIISAGRFVEKAKQFSLLLRAFALLKEKYPDWDLEICGDGEAMPEYQNLARELGLGERLRLPGMLTDLTPRYAAADIFCIPSKVEGFGMVTVEAQALSLPAVGFAACPGTNEIIVHGENGYLAGEMTPECLAACLARLMDDPVLRRTMGTRGKEMLARYTPDSVYDAWEAMLLKAARRKGRTRIQEILSMETAPNAETAAVRELLGRANPFDRSHYLAMHARCKSEGKPSPFSEKEIAGFVKKQRLFGFPGYRSPLTELRRLGRRLLA